MGHREFKGKKETKVIPVPPVPPELKGQLVRQARRERMEQPQPLEVMATGTLEVPILESHLVEPQGPLARRGQPDPQEHKVSKAPKAILGRKVLRGQLERLRQLR